MNLQRITLYACTQQELYAVARLGWQSHQNNSADFLAFKASYTAAYASSAIAEIDAAEALPDFQARNATAELLRFELFFLAKESLYKWQALKRYIAAAWPPWQQKPHFEAAGLHYYSSASKNDWEDVKGLMMAGLNFINLHETDLLANDNMPTDFKDEFSDAKENFDTGYLAFIHAEQQALLGTTAKITANNTVYRKLIAMFIDGQHIYKAQLDMAYQFTFSRVLRLVSNPVTPKKAAVSGNVRNAADGQPIADVEVRISDTVRVYTDAAGNYLLKDLDAGSYQLVATKPGYQVGLEHFVLAKGEEVIKDFALLGIDG